MTDFLYLDTARVGRPSHQTVRAGTDSLQFAADEGGSANFDRFLQSGLADCPQSMWSRYAGLQSWRGVPELKADLRTLVGGLQDFPVLLSNRSAQLMTLAAWLLFPRCRNVLTCDLGWPVYQEILTEQAARASRKVTIVPVSDLIFGEHATAHEIVDQLVQKYIANRCDGLFLAAVSNLGVQLPIESIVRRIEAVGNVRLVVVDGAQQFCHTVPKLATDYCDFYITGCHKWLSGHHPTGIGFYGRQRSREFIDTMLDRLLESGQLDDPLLRFVRQIESKATNNYTETVNLAGPFTCQAAVAEMLEQLHESDTAAARATNRQIVADLVAGTDWEPKPIHHEMQSGILFAQAKSDSKRVADPQVIRNSFRQAGVVLTTYTNGYLRLSMPNTLLTEVNRSRLQAALNEVATV